MQVKERSLQINLISLSSDSSSKDSPAAASDEEKQDMEPRNHAEDDQITVPPPVQSELGIEEVAVNNQPAVVNEESAEINTEEEDGWQPVQRPRSAGSTGQRLRQRRANIGRVYNYQKNDVGTETTQSRGRIFNSNNCYYLSKKRTSTPRSYISHQPAKSPSPFATKFSRKLVKAVTYRVVKPVPSTSNAEIAGISGNGGPIANTMPEPHPISAPKDYITLNNEKNNPSEIASLKKNDSIIQLGRSPSYKDVALAPPGTIAKVHGRRQSKEDPSDNRKLPIAVLPVLLITYNGEERKESIVADGNIENVTRATDIDNPEGEKSPKSIPDSVFHASEENEGVEKKEERKSVDEREKDTLQMVSTDTELDASGSSSIGSNSSVNAAADEEQDVLHSGIQSDGNAISPEAANGGEVNVNILSGTIGTENCSSSNLHGECCEKASSNRNMPACLSSSIAHGEEDHAKVSVVGAGENDPEGRSPAPNAGDARNIAHRKLSASAAPFNPSAVMIRGPVAMNVSLSPGTGAVPAVPAWPVNMTLHPVPTAVVPTAAPMTSPHHPYVSSPRSPNILHPLPFMYPPPYTHPQGVPNSSFAVNSNVFHPSYVPWQCNMNSNASEFVPGTLWPACPIEFSVMPTVANPIAEPTLELKIPASSSEVMSSNLVDTNNGEESKKEGSFALEVNNGGNAAPAGVGSENNQESSDTKSQISEYAKIEPNCDASPKENSKRQEFRNNKKIEGDGSFSILIRGRRNRKQTLRLPMSLLNRPHGTKSFKVCYNRVIRGTDIPKSSEVSSSADSTQSCP